MKSLFKRLSVMLLLSAMMLAVMYTCREETPEYKIEYFKFKSGEFIPYDLPDTKYHVYTIIDGQTVETRSKPAAAEIRIVDEAFNGSRGLAEHFGDLFAGCAWEGADFVFYITELDADMAQELADIGEYDDFVFCKVKYPYSELAALRDKIFDYGIECKSYDFIISFDQKLNKIELLIMEDNLIHEKIAAKLKEWANPDMYIIEKYPAITDQTAADKKNDVEDRSTASGN